MFSFYLSVQRKFTRLPQLVHQTQNNRVFLQLHHFVCTKLNAITKGN